MRPLWGWTGNKWWLDDARKPRRLSKSKQRHVAGRVAAVQVTPTQAGNISAILMQRSYVLYVGAHIYLTVRNAGSDAQRAVVEAKPPWKRVGRGGCTVRTNDPPQHSN